MIPIEGNNAILLAAVAGLVLGLLLGWLIWGRTSSKQQTLAMELASARSAAEEAVAHRSRLEREIAAMRDQVTPLADEVDRLRREIATERARKPSIDAASAQTGASAFTSAMLAGDHDRAAATTNPELRAEKLPTFLEAPHGTPDDLRMLKGVGEKLSAKLNAIGIFHFHQIANWTPDEVRIVDSKLDQFRGRIERDQWIDQAKLLAAGRYTEYEARFGKLGSSEGPAA